MKIYFKFAGIGMALLVLGLTANLALAQTPNVQYPVAELGNCTSQSACKTYCDDPAHSSACLDFAEKNGLMTPQEVATAKKVTSGQLNGPGGCTSKDQCQAYCNDISHIEECVTFAKANNLMPPQDLAQAEKIANALKQGVKPPNCKNKEECNVYCNQPAHMEECTTFAFAAGLITGQEKTNAEGMLKAIKAGVNPPACQGKDACDKYCSDPAHQDECTKFAVAAGFMSQADLQKMQEGQQQFKQGLLNATGKLKDCLVAAFGGDLSNVSPTKDNGDKMQKCFEQFPPQQGQGQGAQNGQPEQFGPGQGGQPGQFGPGQGQGPQNGQPGQFGPEQGPGPQNGQPNGNFVGPGGCKTPGECSTYCASHPDECKNFTPPQPQNGSGQPGQMMPQGPNGQQNGQPGQFGPNQGPQNGQPDQYGPQQGPQNGQPGQMPPPQNGQQPQGYLHPQNQNGMLPPLQQNGQPGMLPPPNGQPGQQMPPPNGQPGQQLPPPPNGQPGQPIQQGAPMPQQAPAPAPAPETQPSPASMLFNQLKLSASAILGF